MVGLSKQGPGEARHVLVEAAWYLARTIGPMRAFHQRIRARRGANVATVAVARKLAVICWHMLTHEEDYAFARPSLTREKLRRLELLTGAERHRGRGHPERVFAPRRQHELERELAAQAETAYKRLTADWTARSPKTSAGAAAGRASSSQPEATSPRGTPTTRCGESSTRLRMHSYWLPIACVWTQKRRAWRQLTSRSRG